MAYYNPEGIPEEAIQEYRRIIIHFRTKEDLIEFNKRTGIQVNTKNKQIHWPINDALEDLFE